MTDLYSFEIQLRWSDQDVLGHVNNARVVTLAEEGRVRFARDHEEMDSPGGRVVARQEIDYHAPTHYGHPLTLQVGVLKVGTTSYTLRQRGIQQGRPVFTVDTVMVNIDDDGASRPLADRERAALEEYMWPQGESSDGQ